jgi:hypothetical protein
MSTDITSEMTILDSAETQADHRNPMIGLVGFMGALAGFGAAFVALTRSDVAVVAQMGVAAAVCGGIALTMARTQH